MVRCRANSVSALWNHAGAGHFIVDLLARKVSADAGLCALADFNFNHRRGFEVVHIHAETARRHLHDGMVAIFLEVFMQATFAAVEIGAQLLGRHGERLLGIQRNRTKAHGREHNGHVELDAGRHR